MGQPFMSMSTYRITVCRKLQLINIKVRQAPELQLEPTLMIQIIPNSNMDLLGKIP